MKRYAFLFAVALAVCHVAFGDVWYVDKDATGAEDGSSWTDAFTTIQEGIDAAGANGGGEIWVAEGAYLESITLASGVRAYGGFDGTEDELSERDIEANATIIDARIADGGGPADHVVVMDSITNCRIDGFTVTGGDADGSSPDDRGGGIYCHDVNDTNTIANCTISGNGAADGGGGVYCYNSSSPSIINCTISGNSTTWEGGGVLCYNSSSPSITNCTISGNWANYGGGLRCSLYCDASVSNSTISGNAAYYGGGVYCSICAPLITNCTISGNLAHWGGGGLFCWTYSDPAITNTIFEDNEEHAIYEFDASSDPIVTNCLFYGNPQGDYYDENTTTYSGAAAINSIPDGHASNNVEGDPLFVNKVAGDFHLRYGSPAIDTGTASGAPSTDFDGEPRPFSTEYDIGADEYVDTDGDGLSSYEETLLGTNPDDPDSDDDGLDDGDEVLTHSTDPNNPDTDDDEMPDGWEVDNDLDPNDDTGDNGADSDPDGDGFTNLDEYDAAPTATRTVTVSLTWTSTTAVAIHRTRTPCLRHHRWRHSAPAQQAVTHRCQYSSRTNPQARSPVGSGILVTAVRVSSRVHHTPTTPPAPTTSALRLQVPAARTRRRR